MKVRDLRKALMGLDAEAVVCFPTLPGSHVVETCEIVPVEALVRPIGEGRFTTLGADGRVRAAILTESIAPVKAKAR